MQEIFFNVITALITPFNSLGIDFASFKRLLELQALSGIKSIVVAGSTGEAATLSFDEYQELLNFAKQNSNLKIIAGCNSSSTQVAIEIAKAAQKIGVDGLMVSIPPYNKPTQEGIYQHFKSIHDASNLPIMLYSVPSRTGVDFTLETIIRLCKLEKVAAFKDAGGNAMRALMLNTELKNKTIILSGDDEATLAFNAHGAKGVVSVMSNLLPEKVRQVQDLWFANNPSQALRLQLELLPLYKSIFAETNPIGIKYAMSLMGLCKQDVRLPLCPMSESSKIIVKKSLQEQKILA